MNLTTIGDEHMGTGKVSSSCSNRSYRCVTLVKMVVKDEICSHSVGFCICTMYLFVH